LSLFGCVKSFTQRAPRKTKGTTNYLLRFVYFVVFVSLCETFSRGER
jgi:hypothetical protein